MEFEDEDHDVEDHEEDEDEAEDEETTTLLTTPTYKTPFDPKKHYSHMTRYKECLKNHAVTLGGHALDGCGEFMPAGPNNSIDSLKCAACACHRNFHRRELYLDTTQQLTVYTPRPPALGGSCGGPAPPHVYQFYPFNRTTPSTPPSRALALPSPLEEHVPMTSSGKKRHRTKFSQEQKDKMLELAERIGWRIQKQNETVVQEFCDQAGISRHVLKVWMHNNKHTLAKKLPLLCDNPPSAM